MTKKWSDEVDTGAVGTKKRHGEKKKKNSKKESHKIIQDPKDTNQPPSTQLLVMICNVIQSCLRDRPVSGITKSFAFGPGAGRQGEMSLGLVDVFEFLSSFRLSRGRRWSFAGLRSSCRERWTNIVAAGFSLGPFRRVSSGI